MFLVFYLFIIGCNVFAENQLRYKYVLEKKESLICHKFQEVSINSKNKTDYKTLVLKNPNRYVVDILTKDKIIIEAHFKTFDKIRIGYHQFGARIVFDKDMNFIFKKIENGFEVCEQSNTNKVVINNSIDKSINQNDANIKKKKITIIIDPGHGGYDPGTISINKKIKEKDVTLKYSQKLKNELEKHGFKVLMTRYGDNFILLQNRVKIARDNNADLLISLHADSSFNQNVKGCTVYSISDIYPSDPDWERFLTNAYTSESIIAKSQDIIKNILIELTRKHTHITSANTAKHIFNSLAKSRICNNVKYKERSLAVLRGTDLNAFLIEIGYLSNFEEEEKLLSDAYADKFVFYLADAIQKYYDKKN